MYTPDPERVAEAKKAAKDEPEDNVQYGRILNVGPADEAETTPPLELFDPADHTVDEVKAYLESADDDEVDRVLALEADGKARKGLLESDES
jgi:hypothetical protein